MVRSQITSENSAAGYEMILGADVHIARRPMVDLELRNRNPGNLNVQLGGSDAEGELYYAKKNNRRERRRVWM